ncbi:MAG: hypothetical protein RL414_636 [Actinomycetota bacterium]
MGIFRRIRLGAEAEGYLRGYEAGQVKAKNDATLIRDYLLGILDDHHNDRESFSDERLEEAAKILASAGPNAFYWMSDIAANMVELAVAQINGIPTNVNRELGSPVTAEEIVNVVVRTDPL